MTTLFTALKAHELRDITIARVTPLVRKLVIHRTPKADWRPIVRGIAITDVDCHLGWLEEDLSIAEETSSAPCSRSDGQDANGPTIIPHTKSFPFSTSLPRIPM